MFLFESKFDSRFDSLGWFVNRNGLAKREHIFPSPGMKITTWKGLKPVPFWLAAEAPFLSGRRKRKALFGSLI